jgi:hypothetical protein
LRENIKSHVALCPLFEPMHNEILEAIGIGQYDNDAKLARSTVKWIEKFR